MDGFLAPDYHYSSVEIASVKSRYLEIPEYPSFGFGQVFFIGKNKIRIDSFDLAKNKLILKISSFNEDQRKIGGLVNMYAPSLMEKDVYGTELKLSSFFNKGEYVLLNFWGTWCGPCKEDHPLLKNLYKKYGKKVNFIGLAVDHDIERVVEYIEEEGLDWQNIFISIRDLYNEQSLPVQFNITGYPTYLLIDPKGKILVRASLNELAFHLEENF